MNSAAEPANVISPLDWYQVFRGRIEHEDNLIIQRLSWLMASQSFLFTAYAIATNGLSAALAEHENIYRQQLFLLVRLIPIVAVCNGLLIYLSVLAALKALRELRRDYQARAGNVALLPIQTSRTTRLLGLSAPLLLPLLFIVVWLVLLLRWGGGG